MRVIPALRGDLLGRQGCADSGHSSASEWPAAVDPLQTFGSARFRTYEIDNPATARLSKMGLQDVDVDPLTPASLLLVRPAAAPELLKRAAASLRPGRARRHPPRGDRSVAFSMHYVNYASEPT